MPTQVCIGAEARTQCAAHLEVGQPKPTRTVETFGLEAFQGDAVLGCWRSGLIVFYVELHVELGVDDRWVRNIFGKMRVGMQGIVRAAVAWLDVNEDGIAVIAACWRQRGCNWRCPGVEIPGHGERDGAVKHCRVWESRATDAMAARSGWLQGKTIRKAGAAANARSATPNQVQSTSSTIFAGGIKDASGRTTEYFVCSSSAVSSLLTSCAVYGRPVSSLQKRQVSQSKIAPASEFLLSQNVCLAPTLALGS